MSIPFLLFTMMRFVMSDCINQSRQISKGFDGFNGYNPKFEKEKEDKTMKNYGNTLLGYFKSGLDRQHCSIKYFNREFLAIFITEYNESKKNGVANYEKTKTTRFYNENGGSYCVFLELWNEYKQGMERAKAYGF